MDDGPDFTTNSCPHSTTYTFGRNAGHSIYCGKALGHTGPHMASFSWSEGASDNTR